MLANQAETDARQRHDKQNERGLYGRGHWYTIIQAESAAPPQHSNPKERGNKAGNGVDNERRITALRPNLP